MNLHLDKNSLHHAYVLEGAREELYGKVLEFARSFPGSELVEITTDTFRIEDARNLKSLSSEKSFSKRLFIISVNTMLREAQNAMLKLFEEPVPDTHFFLIVPDTNSLLKTLLSRFYVISLRRDSMSEAGKTAEEFIRLPTRARIEYLKSLIADTDDETETPSLDSARSRALRFLDALEYALHQKILSRVALDTGKLDMGFFEHFFKVREMLRMPGSSVKNLLESVALAAPVIQ